MAQGQSTTTEPPATAPHSTRSAPARAATGAWNAIKPFFAFAADHRLWTLAMTAFILVWTIELYVVQEVTLVYPNEVGANFARWAAKVRLVLDLLFIAFLAVALPRRWLVVAVLGSFGVYVGLVAYYDHFLRPLSLTTMLVQWRDAVRLGRLGVEFAGGRPLMILVATLLLKLAALGLMRTEAPPRRSRWCLAALLLAGYVGLSTVTVYLDPLDAIRTTRGIARLGYARGYLGPWFAEWYYLNDDDLLDRALAQRKHKYDRITPLEADIPIRRKLAIVQVESLDTNVLDYEVDGVEVTPFLNSMRRRAMYFRVEAIHTNGSLDADFVALNGVLPSPDANTYLIPRYPYENTTPQILAECGFKSYSFHGMSGAFFDRRAAYEKMGFTGIRFLEELTASSGRLPPDSWGLRDHDVLRASAREMSGARVPTCHFIITLTTHVPYTLLRPDEWQIYPQPQRRAEHYLNNMRYLDNCLRDYVTSFDDGATVVIYADHPTEEFAGFTADRAADAHREFIPALIYDTDEDLSQLQQTRNDARSTDGTWNLVDVANYLRGQIRRARGAP